jgi:hypothetical protein
MTSPPTTPGAGAATYLPLEPRRSHPVRHPRPNMAAVTGHATASGFQLALP